MSANTNIGNTPVNQGYVQLIHTGETGGIDGTLRTLYDGDGTASDLQIASNKVKVSTTLYIGSDTLQEYIQDTVGAMLVTNASHTNLSAAYDDAGDGAIDLTASGDVTLTNTVTLSNKTLAAPTLTGTTQGASITLSGDLTVNGTTTTVNQTNLDVSDNIIGLNRGSGSNANDSGLIIERGSTGDNAAIIWDESADKFTLGTTTSTPSATGDLTISTGTLVATIEGNVTGNVTGSASLNLLTSNNLSDLASASTARSNLGLGSLAELSAVNASTITDNSVGADELNVSGDGSSSQFLRSDGDGTFTWATPTDTNTTYIGGTNLTLDGTTFNVDDAFLINSGNDTTSGTITAGGFTTTGNLSLAGHAVNDIDIGSEFVDADDHLMSAGAIKEKIESYGYTTTGAVTALNNATANELVTVGSTTTELDAEANLTFDGSSNLDLLSDSGKLRIGAGNDLEIYHDGTDDIINTKGTAFKLLDNGTERLRINSSGNIVINENGNSMDFRVEGDTVSNLFFVDGSADRVGIGTSSPSDKLEIAGPHSQLRLTDSDDGQYIQMSLSSDALLFRHNTTSGTAAVAFKDDGTVGIGTNSPSEKLEVSGANSDTYIEIHNNGGYESGIKMLGGSLDVWKIYLDDADNKLRIDEDGTAYMTIDGSGNVGIGTTSPAGKLHIQESGTGAGNGGVISETATHNGNSGYRWRTNGTDRWAVTTIGTNGADLRFRDEDAGAERMRIDSSGNVGIGLTSPASPLNVKSNSTSSSDSGITITQNGGSNAIFKMAEKSTDGGRFHMYDGGTEKIAFYTDGTANHISAGNVGIGTTSPGYKLDVAGQGKVTNGWLVDNGTTAGFFTTDSDNVNFGSSTSGKGLRLFSANAEKMRIDSSGNVGIGTTSPYERLYVECEDTTSPGIVSNPAATNGAIAYAIGYGDSNKDYINTWGMSYSAGANVFGYGVKPKTDADEEFINSADNASFKRGALYFDDELKFFNAAATTGTIDTAITMTERFRVDVDGDGFFDRDVVAYSTTVSDKRLKDNVKTIDNAVDKVMKLRGVEFDWNATSRKGQHDLGLIAQEVEQVLPELVREKNLCTGEFGGKGNEKEFKTVDYDKIVGVLIEAIKEQQEEIECLKANYDQLKYNRR